MTEDIDSYEGGGPGSLDSLRAEIRCTPFEWPKLSNQSEIPTFQ